MNPIGWARSQVPLGIVTGGVWSLSRGGPSAVAFPRPSPKGPGNTAEGMGHVLAPQWVAGLEMWRDRLRVQSFCVPKVTL